MKEDRVIKGLIIGTIVISIITIVLVYIVKNKSKDTEPNINYDMENSKVITLKNNVDTSSISVPENAATIEQVEAKVSEVSADINKSNIIEKLSLNASDSKNNITRYQLADLLYNIIKDENKLPLVEDTKLYYDDADEILEQYATQIRYTSYLRLYDFGWTFSGFTYVTSDEFNNSMNKLNEYLNNYIPVSTPINNKNDESDDKMQGKIFDDSVRDEIRKELESRDYSDTDKYTDKLNGQSVAVYKNPKTPEEIEANISQIRRVNITDYTDKISDKNRKKLNIDYLNLHEALVDYSLLDEIDVIKDLGIRDKIVGVTYVNGATLTKHENNYGFKYIENNLYNQLRWGRLSFPELAIAIKNGIIVGHGYIPDDMEKPYITVNTDDYDTIALLVRKVRLESSADSNKYIIVCIGCDNNGQ